MLLCPWLTSLTACEEGLFVAGMTVTPRQLNKIVSHMPVVNHAVRDETVKRAQVAEGVLEAHKREGHSRIVVMFGVTDGYFGLSDDRGRHAAAAIEYGYPAGYRYRIDRKTGRLVVQWFNARRPVGALRAGIEYRG